MNISKSTHNYAARRNVEMYEMERAIFFIKDPDNNECTSVVYSLGPLGLTFVKQFDPKLEDLPAHIPDELKLKELINYISAQG